MRLVKTDQLEPGLIIGRDVEGYEGYKLLREGTLLTDAHIALLETWHIGEVWVGEKSAPAPAAAEAAPPKEDPILQAAKMRLMRRFQGALVNEWMKALCDEAEKRLSSPRFWRTTW